MHLRMPWLVDIQETQYLMGSLIECRDLIKSYNGIKALDGLSLSINTGASIGLVGPNGAGKSTFFSLLCGFLRATSGALKVMGQTPDASILKGRISILPQDVPFMKGISVQSQLLLFARLHGFSKYAARQEIERVLELLNVSSLARQFPETLSFGQRKKVTMAQALIGNPELVLLDEPTSGLDPVAANEVRALIQKLRHEHSFMVSSHNLDEIEDVCDEIVVINKGKLVKHCAITELVERNNYLTLLLNQPLAESLRQSLTNLPGILKVEPVHANLQRISICFRSDNPDELQFRILELLQQNGAGVIELNRGTVFADKVVELVKGH